MKKKVNEDSWQREKVKSISHRTINIRLEGTSLLPLMKVQVLMVIMVNYINGVIKETILSM